MLLIEKVMVAVLSALIFSLLFAYLVDSPGSFAVVFMYYSLPIYFLCGGIYSVFADVFLEKIQFKNKVLKYITSLSVYATGGLLVLGLIIISSLLDGIEGFGEGIYFFFLLCEIASLLFFHILLGWRKILSYVHAPG